MRKVLILGVAVLALAGCGTRGGGPIIPQVISPATDQSTVDKIRNGVAKACGFLPDVASVAEVLATFTGGGGIVSITKTVISGICNAVTAKGVRRGVRAPMYRGVLITGQRA